MATKPNYTQYKAGAKPAETKNRLSKAKKIAAEKTAAKVAAQAATPKKNRNYWDN